jgi:ArsR family transcriptional regulator
MVISKSCLFDADLQQSARVFKALSHPARLEILRFLALTKTCITGDISGEIPLSRTTVTQHLKELKKAGLIRGEISGVKTKYCLDPAGLVMMKKLSERFLSEILSNGQPCC